MTKKYMPPTEEDKKFNEKHAGKFQIRRFLTGKTYTDKDGNEVNCLAVEIVRTDKE